MPRKLPPLNLDDLYRRYQCGETISHIAESIGLTSSALNHRFTRAGYTLRPSGRARKHPGVDTLRRLYCDELQSCAVIARQFDVAEATVRRWLRSCELVRSQPESLRLFYRRTTEQERQSITAAANIAARGRTASADELERRAHTRQLRGVHHSPLEAELSAMLHVRNVSTIAQCAVGPFNVDLAAAPVAVEVFGGSWHNTGRHAARHNRRIRYLLDSGWHVIIVWVEQPAYFLTVEAAEYIVAMLNSTRSHPTTECQYRVIRGTGQEIIRGCAKDDHFPLKPTRKRGALMRCEHDAGAD